MKYVFGETGGARKCHSKLAAGPVCCYFINPAAPGKIKSGVATSSNGEAQRFAKRGSLKVWLGATVDTILTSVCDGKVKENLLSIVTGNIWSFVFYSIFFFLPNFKLNSQKETNQPFN